MKNTQTTTIASKNVLRVISAIAVIAFGWLLASANVSAACQLTLTWQDNSSNEDGFKIERATSSLGPWTQIAQVSPSPASYQDNGVVPYVIYFYRLRAYNAAGDSAYSNVDSANTPCLGPADSVGDGIPDSWRQTYWGGSGTTTNKMTCATCDADGTGQNNLFKYVAGLDPTDPTSVFILTIESVSSLPKHKNLVFLPVASGRTYTPQYSTNLASKTWFPLTSYAGPLTNGSQIKIIDLNAVQPNKFYRIDISLP